MPGIVALQKEESRRFRVDSVSEFEPGDFFRRYGQCEPYMILIGRNTNRGPHFPDGYGLSRVYDRLVSCFWSYAGIGAERHHF